MRSSVQKISIILGLLLICSTGLSVAQVRDDRPPLEMTDPTVEGYERSSYGPQGGFEFNEGQRGQQEETILVKTGQRVYCSQCGIKLDDTVTFAEVPLDQAGEYFDDGSHFDDYARDGLPTNIDEIRDEYIGPYCEKVKNRLTKYYLKAEQPNNWGYYTDAQYPSYWASIAFFGLPATTLDPDIPLEKLSFWDGFMTSVLSYWRDMAIAPYEGYPVHEDMLAKPVIQQRGMGFMGEPGMGMEMEMMMMEGPGMYDDHPTGRNLEGARNAQRQYR